jgi:hypothetical protein
LGSSARRARSLQSSSRRPSIVPGASSTARRTGDSVRRRGVVRRSPAARSHPVAARGRPCASDLGASDLGASDLDAPELDAPELDASRVEISSPCAISNPWAPERDARLPCNPSLQDKYKGGAINPNEALRLYPAAAT